MTVLAAVSGGLDSVAMLWVLLAQGSEPVHVHHVSLRSKSGRWKAEDAAMARILPAMRDVVDFGYSESIYDTRKQGLRYDVTIVSTECAKACKRLGLVPTAYMRGGAAHDESRAGIKNRRAKAAQAWKAAWAPAPAPKIVFPVRHMTRREMWAALPENIRSAVWSCRKPASKGGVVKPCGQCHTCREFEAENLVHPEGAL